MGKSEYELLEYIKDLLLFLLGVRMVMQLFKEIASFLKQCPTLKYLEVKCHYVWDLL